MKEKKLTIQNLSVGYSARTILTGIDLAFTQEDCWILRGPNGSGKTTFLKTLAGLLPSLIGKIDHPQDSRLAYVPAENMINSTLPLQLEEIILMGSYRLQPSGFRYTEKLRNQALVLLEQLGLLAKRQQAFLCSSSGEKQRTLLARALMGEPDFLLMDEPTSNLDQESLTYFMTMLQTLRENRVGMIICTHDDKGYESLHPASLEVHQGTLVLKNV